MEKSNFSNLRGNIYCMLKSNALYDDILEGWKSNMSNPKSKLISERIDWSIRNEKIPLLILGAKGNKVRYAVHGGSEDIRYMDVENLIHNDSILLLEQCKNNDDVNEWRKNTDLVVDNNEKSSSGRPRKIKVVDEEEIEVKKEPKQKKERKRRISQKQIGDGTLIDKGDEMWIEAPWNTCLSNK